MFLLMKPYRQSLIFFSRLHTGFLSHQACSWILVCREGTKEHAALKKKRERTRPSGGDINPSPSQFLLSKRTESLEQAITPF